MKKELTKLEVGCESIRKDIKECGKLYITVAYKVYELYIYGVYKEKYKNIVDCCKNEFGFKKSTVYNFLGIVEKFGEKENGIVTYRSLMKYDKFSYSQLTEMLSLSDGQRTKVTPDTAVSEIRKIKKGVFQTSGKKVEEVKVSESEPDPNVIEVLPEQFQVEKVQTSGKIEDFKVSESEPNIIEILPEQFQVEKVPTSGKKVEEIKISESEPEPEVIEVLPDQLHVEKVQTFGKIENSLVQQQLELYDNDVERTISGLIERINSFEFSTNHFRNLFEHREKVVKQLKEEKEQLYKESESKLRNLLEKSDAFRERLLKDEETIKSQSETIADYMKRNEKLIYRNSILETDNGMLKTKIQQLEKKISQLEAEKKEQNS